MSNPRSGKGQDVGCACDVTFPDPWDLVAHLLAVYPPHADRPLDGTRHADVTRLAVKLGARASGAWEVTTWATTQRKDLRVAASIAYRVKTGDLERWGTILRQEIRNTYQVSMHVVANAIEILKDFGIIENCDGRNVVACDDVDQAISQTYSAGQLLQLIARHVASIEDEVAALKN